VLWKKQVFLDVVLVAVAIVVVTKKGGCLPRRFQAWQYVVANVTNTKKIWMNKKETAVLLLRDPTEP
jgi:hypothetical protein